MIVRAKLIVPAVTAATVRRSRLDRALEQAASETRLTVVQAPAGYGKTTAVCAWLAVSGRPAAWVTLDRHDNDARRLMSHLLAALETVLPEDSLSGAAWGLSGGSDLSLTVIPALAEALERDAPERLAIVFDDFHLISDADARTAVRELIDSLPRSVHAVVLSRTRPALRLARRLAAGEAAVIDAHELAFSAAEAAALLKRVDQLELDPEDLQTAVRRLDGWAAGLRLLASALGLTPADGQARVFEALSSLTRSELVDYVVDELLGDAGPLRRKLMTQTAVLPRFNGELAAAVTGEPEAQAEVERLREDGQFVSAEPHAGGWVRVHDLIREALLVFLRRLEPGLEPTLRGRAADWLEQHGLVTEALDQAIAAADSGRLKALLETHGAVLAIERNLTLLRQAFNALAAAGTELSPALQAIELFVQLSEGVPPRQLAEATWALHEAHPDNFIVHAITSVMVASPMFGELKRSVEAGLAAIERFPETSQSLIRVVPALATSLQWEGRTAEAKELIAPVFAAEQHRHRLMAHAVMARSLIVEEDAKQAEWYAREAVALLESSGFETAPEFAWVRGMMAEALLIAGKLEEARTQMDMALALERRRPGTIVQAGLLLADTRLAIGERRRARARASLRDAKAIFDTFPDIGARNRAELARLERELATATEVPSLGSAPTEAELRVLAELAHTASRAQIGERLYLSEGTVKSHLRRLYRRLGVDNRADALAAAAERGLLSDSA